MDTTSNVSNRFTIRKNEKEQYSDDEYSVNTIEVESSPQPYRDNTVTVHRVFNRHLMNQTPDYERKINYVRVRHTRWPQRWIKN